MNLAKNLYEPNEIERKPTRDGFGDGLVDAGKKNDDVVALCAAASRSEWH